MRERDQERREAWKHRARQTAVDRAGVCTGEIECCPCPNCREYREFYRLHPGESRHKVHIGHDDRGSVVKWIWARYDFLYSRGWRRKDTATGRFFGPLVRYIDPCQEGVVHHIRTRTVGEASIRDEVIIHETVRPMFTHGLDSPWADPPRKPADLVTPEVGASFLHGDWEEKKEHPVLTALQLAILAHYLVQPDTPYPHARLDSDAVRQAFASLLANELLEHRLTGGYKTTSRTTVYFRAINTLPLPIRKQAPWTMPETPQPQFGDR